MDLRTPTEKDVFFLYPIESREGEPSRNREMTSAKLSEMRMKEKTPHEGEGGPGGRKDLRFGFWPNFLKGLDGSLSKKGTHEGNGDYLRALEKRMGLKEWGG